VDEGRESIGLKPVSADVGGKWIREHAAKLAAVLPPDPADVQPMAPSGNEDKETE
jgi:hypothetical protein